MVPIQKSNIDLSVSITFASPEFGFFGCLLLLMIDVICHAAAAAAGLCTAEWRACTNAASRHLSYQKCHPAKSVEQQHVCGRRGALEFSVYLFTPAVVETLKCVVVVLGWCLSNYNTDLSPRNDGFCARSSEVCVRIE